ncbi:MAG: hypothetical protein BZ136_04970 [Methanosphaera sp. rholeuAM74]|nr:MAG: hypothetical protein BZ136_04970 [Methanosphaera sp. rholeuAM74]
MNEDDIMDKKKIAIIIVILAILLGVYQFVYVPYQNEQANLHYNEGLKNVSAIDNEISDSFKNSFNVTTSNVSGGIESTIQSFKNMEEKSDQKLEILNKTRSFTNGNKTKEQYIDYQIESTQIQKDMASEIVKDYEELNDAFKSADFNKIMNISTQIQTTVNSTIEKMKSIEDKLSTLLNENPGFNQTLQDLNITDKNYLSKNIPNPSI